MSTATKENINRIIELTGSTHQQVADIAGVDRSAVSHWKSGKSEPSMAHLKTIADHYGITTENLAAPQGMKYIRRGAGGRLVEDKDAKLADLKESIFHLDADSSVDDILRTLQEIGRYESPEQPLSSEERELVDMFRLLNDSGRSLVLETVAAFVKAGSYASR